MPVYMPAVVWCRQWPPGAISVRVISPSIVRIVWPVVSGTPEIVVYDRCIDICRFYDVVFSIQVRVANDLYISVVEVVSADFDSGYILIHIRTYYGLYHYEMCIVSRDFYQTQVINISITVEIQVGDLQRRVIQFPLQLFEAVRHTKKRCNCL